MTDFDWTTMTAVSGARLDAVPEMIGRALRVLEDLLEQVNHACTFTLTDGPLTDDDVTLSVGALLPKQCRVSALEPAGPWSAAVRSALPGLFAPSRPPHTWTGPSPAWTLAETLTDWVVALLGRLWPDTAECWSLTVETRGWYEGAYVDLVVRVDDRVWLLHLGVTD